MPKTIVLRFHPYDFKAWLFAEHVSGWLRDKQWGETDLQEIDTTASHFHVTGVHNSKLRRVTRWLETEARQHHVQMTMELIQ